MRRICSGIVGLALAMALAGCGDTTDEGPKGFKPTDVTPLEPLKQQLQEVAKNKSYEKRQLPPEQEGKDKDKGKANGKEAKKP